MKEYIYLKSLHDKYPFFTVPDLVKHLSAVSATLIPVIFRSGRFVADRRDSVEQAGYALSQIGEKNERLRKNAVFQRTIMTQMSNPNFHLSLFVTKLNEYPFEFGLFGDAESCLARITEVYNYRVQEDKRVRLRAA